MQQFRFFLFLSLSIFALSLMSCVKDEEDPEYTSYQTTTEETTPEAKAQNDAKDDEKLLADAVKPVSKVEEKGSQSPVTFTPTKEAKKEALPKEAKTTAVPVSKTEVSASELRREAAPSKVALPAPVTHERGVDKMVSKGTEATSEPRVVRGTAIPSTKPTPVVTEPTISQPATLRGKTAVFSIDKSNHEFGFIDEGTKITHVYTIKNTGGTDLYINDVKPSCNCTVPDFSIESVPPGGSTTVKLVFDSNGKVGTQRKTATVMTNIGEYELTMTGTVRPKSKNY